MPLNRVARASSIKFDWGRLSPSYTKKCKIGSGVEDDGLSGFGSEHSGDFNLGGAHDNVCCGKNPTVLNNDPRPRCSRRMTARCGL